MHEQEKLREYEIQQQAKNKEEEEKNLQKQMASMKLAYDSMDKQRGIEEAKLKNDPISRCLLMWKNFMNLNSLQTQSPLR